MKDFSVSPFIWIPLHRVLITGQIPFIPEWIQSKIEEELDLSQPRLVMNLNKT